MKNFVKTRIVSLFEAMRSIAIIAVVAMIGFSMVACSDDDGGGGSGGNVVLASGYAWTDFYEYGAYSSDGIIFYANGTYSTINNQSGSWEIDATGTYSASNGFLTISSSYGYYTGISNCAYSVSGNSIFVTDGQYTVELRSTNVGTVQ